MTPLPLAAAAFALGVLAPGAWLGRGWAAAACASGLATALCGLPPRRPPGPIEAAGLLPERERILAAAGFRSPPRDPHLPRRLVALGLGFVLLGAGWASLRQARPERSGLIDGSYVAFNGRLVSDPRDFAFGWGAEARIAWEGTQGPRARVWLRGRGRPPPIEAGARVRGGGAVRLLRRGDSSFGDHLLARGAVAIVTSRRLEVVPVPPGLPLRAANAIRAWLRSGATDVLPPREAGLLLGLAIGDLRTMDPEVEEDFRATGLGHLVAVSGSNVAMVLAPILALAMLLRLGPWGRVAIGAVAVALFALVTRWEPSVLRASVMAVLGLLGVLAGRPRSTATVLAGAALGLLVADPGLARSLGFQLSVAATAGLVMLAGPIADRLTVLPRPVGLALGATLGAQLAVSPLLLLSFGVVPLASVPANLLAVPLVVPALALGILASALAVPVPAAGAALGSLAALPLGLLAEVADRTAKASLPAVTGAGLVPPFAAAALVLGIGWRLRRRPARRRSAAVAAVLVMVAAGGVGGGAPAAPIVTFFDVGQGDAALIRTPEGTSVLIDAGPDHDHVATRLAALGVRRLDLVVSSHAHADHIEGFAAVLARHRVGLMLDPLCPADSPAYAELRRAARAEEVPLRAARGGSRYRLGRLVVDILGPDACGEAGPNDDSAIVRLAYGDASLLFPGDAEHAAQQDLLDDADPVAADVLKVPHHGGDTSLDPFLAAVGAKVAVVSTGPNTYGHPVPSVLATLRSTGARVLRTDLLGEITLRLEPGRIVVGSAR